MSAPIEDRPAVPSGCNRVPNVFASDNFVDRYVERWRKIAPPAGRINPSSGADGMKLRVS